jgi:urease accessory protein
MVAIAPAVAPTPAPASAGRHGEGRLIVARRGGESRVLSAFARTPLQLVVPRAPGAAVWAFATNHGGGLVDGDDVALSVEVGDGACALLTTQASTKVYRRRDVEGGAAQRIDARVGEGALLALVPDPVCCFADASFVQRTTIDVARGGALVLVEALVAGRVASGERWLFSRYDARLAISLGGVPRVHERLLLAPEDGSIAARMGRFDAFATVVVLGEALAGDARALLDEVSAARPARGEALQLSASPLGAAGERGVPGVIVRLAADGAETLSKRLRSILSFLPRHLGDDPFARKL